jgi:hypothetical protein
MKLVGRKWGVMQKVKEFLEFAEAETDAVGDIAGERRKMRCDLDDKL